MLPKGGVSGRRTAHVPCGRAAQALTDEVLHATAATLDQREVDRARTQVRAGQAMARETHEATLGGEVEVVRHHRFPLFCLRAAFTLARWAAFFWSIGLIGRGLAPGAG